MRQAADRLSILWYLGYDLGEPLPDHSSLTRIRERYGLNPQIKLVGAEVPPEEPLMVFSFLVGRARSPETGGFSSPGVRPERDPIPLPWSTADPALNLL